MKHFPIGIMLECLRLDFYQSLDRAVELGADGFQLCFFGPDPMPRNEFLQKRAAIESHHLTVSAVCGELGWFTDPVGNVEKIKRMETIFNFAYDLGVHVVTGHIGPVPEDKDDPVYRALYDAMITLGRMARERNLIFASETGPESTVLMRRFLDALDGGIGVNFDPANLVMRGFSKNGADSVEAVAPYIVHTHAKDGLSVRLSDRWPEVPLGKGDVDFPLWMKTLWNCGYRGFLTIERECGDDPATDIAEAIRYLRETDQTLDVPQ